MKSKYRYRYPDHEDYEPYDPPMCTWQDFKDIALALLITVTIAFAVKDRYYPEPITYPTCTKYGYDIATQGTVSLDRNTDVLRIECVARTTGSILDTIPAH